MAPVAGASDPGHTPHVEIVDPLMRWVMDTLHPLLANLAPWLYAIDRGVLGWSLLLLTAGVMAWAGRQFYVRAWRAGRHGGADMNTLVAVGTGAAFLYSLVATVAPQIFLRRGLMPDVYFEAVILIIALILTGRAFEARAKRRIGLGITGLNPTLIATWTAVTATAFSTGLATYSLWGAVMFAVGVFAGISLWFLLLLEGLDRFRDRVTPRTLDRIVQGMGVFLLIVGAWFLGSAALALSDWSRAAVP